MLTWRPPSQTRPHLVGSWRLWRPGGWVARLEELQPRTAVGRSASLLWLGRAERPWQTLLLIAFRKETPAEVASRDGELLPRRGLEYGAGIEKRYHAGQRTEACKLRMINTTGLYPLLEDVSVARQAAADGVLSVLEECLRIGGGRQHFKYIPTFQSLLGCERA